MTGPVGPRGEVRVLVIDDHVLFAETLVLALSIEGYDVRRLPQGTASASAMLAAAIRTRPRIVLLDLDLGKQLDGSRMIGPLAASGAQVVVVTGSLDRSRWGECLLHGARKVIPKTQGLREVLSVVRRIHQGLPVLDRSERDDLLRHWHQKRTERESATQRLMLLTKREQEVLAHLMLGRQVREVAELSTVSEATVRTQVKSILAKLEVTSQLAAVGLAHQVGWTVAPAAASLDPR